MWKAKRQRERWDAPPKEQQVNAKSRVSSNRTSPYLICVQFKQMPLTTMRFLHPNEGSCLPTKYKRVFGGCVCNGNTMQCPLRIWWNSKVKTRACKLSSCVNDGVICNVCRSNAHLKSPIWKLRCEWWLCAALHCTKSIFIRCSLFRLRLLGCDAKDKNGHQFPKSHRVHWAKKDKYSEVLGTIPGAQNMILNFELIWLMPQFICRSLHPVVWHWLCDQ